jgi:hypothetical protein
MNSGCNFCGFKPAPNQVVGGLLASFHLHISAMQEREIYTMATINFTRQFSWLETSLKPSISSSVLFYYRPLVTKMN